MISKYVVVYDLWCVYVMYIYRYNCHERSPIFIMFLDTLYQIMSQFPEAFEYTEQLLLSLSSSLFSCQYGTFLYDNEKKRTEEKLRQNTESLWGYVHR